MAMRKAEGKNQGDRKARYPSKKNQAKKWTEGRGDQRPHGPKSDRVKNPASKSST